MEVDDELDKPPNRLEFNTKWESTAETAMAMGHELHVSWRGKHYTYRVVKAERHYEQKYLHITIELVCEQKLVFP